MGYVIFLSVTIVTDMIFRRQAKLVELNNPGPKCWISRYPIPGFMPGEMGLKGQEVRNGMIGGDKEPGMVPKLGNA